MTALIAQLAELYLKLGGGVLLGWVLGLWLPRAVSLCLGRFLFWIGVPLSIVAFFRRADLSGSVWLAPLMAVTALLLGCGFAWGVWRLRSHFLGIRSDKAAQGSFVLAAMFGNTGYLGYPIALALVGETYFSWAVFYDIGTTLGAYSLGIALACYFSGQSPRFLPLLQGVFSTPGLYAIAAGLWFQSVALPAAVETLLQGAAWTILYSSLLLIGMRLAQLRSWEHLSLAALPLTLKMLLIPLILAWFLGLTPIAAPARLAIVLQMAMPPAFATLIIAEAYNLDRELAVTALALGSGSLLLTLPLWLWLLSP